MKFIQYLTEVNLPQLAFNNYLENIKRDCKPYLSLLKKNNILPFMRGIDIDKSYGKKPVQQHRKSKGMMPAIAKSLNKFLVKYKHVRRDKAVIATSSDSHALDFGNLYYIFPIGNFNYTWFNSIKVDINFDIDFTYILLDYDKALCRSKSWEASGYEEKINKFFITNSGIKKASDNFKEIWFDCKEYYYCRTNLFKSSEELKGSFNL